MSRTGVRPGVPEAGPPTIRGQGGAGLSLLDLGVSRGGTPKVPEKAGRVGLDITLLDRDKKILQMQFL